MAQRAVQDPQPKTIRTPVGRWLALSPFGRSTLGVFGTSEADALARLQERLEVWRALANEERQGDA